MNDQMPDPPRYFFEDYTRDREMAQMSFAVMHSSALVEQSLQNVLDQSAVERLLPRGWKFVENHELAMLDNNATSGLVAMSFQAPGDLVITVAIRGIDNLADMTGPALALVEDGPLLTSAVEQLDPLGIGAGNTTSKQLDTLQGMVMKKGWDPQFGEALDYVDRIRKAYPDQQVEVTGYGIGGSIAQVACHTYGLNGRAFNPLGAQNIIESPQYAQFLKDHGIDQPAGLTAPVDRTDPGGFVSYSVKRSLYTSMGGAQLGQVRAISPAAGREGVDDWTGYGIGVGADALGKVRMLGAAGKAGLVVGRAREVVGVVDAIGTTLATGKAGDLSDFKDMQRLVRAFERAEHEYSLPTFGQDTQRGESPRLGARQGNASPQPTMPGARPSQPLAPTDPAHRDHALYGQVLTQVQQLDAGDHLDQGARERIAASLLVLARQHGGIDRVDHVVLSRATPEFPIGENIVVIKGGLMDPAQHRAHMTVATAARTPAVDAFHQLEAVNGQLEQQRQHAVTMGSPEQGHVATYAPSMRL